MSRSSLFDALTSWKRKSFAVPRDKINIVSPSEVMTVKIRKPDGTFERVGIVTGPVEFTPDEELSE